MSLTTTIAIGAAVCCAATASTLFLPRAQTVERKTIVKAAASDVYNLLTSARRYQSFNPYKDTDPALKIEFFGPEEGMGSGFRFEGKEGKGSQTIVALDPNRSVTVEIDLGPMGKPETTFSLQEIEAGTEVTWSTTSDFGYSPVGRIAGLFLEKMLGKTYERGLENMGREAVAVR